MSTEKKSLISQAIEFVPQVRQEVKKVTWPSRRETMLTTIFVFVLAMIAAIFFTIIDHFSYKIVAFVLGIAG